MTRLHGLFVLMCVLWGATWLAIKVGLSAVPPFQLAAARMLAAGALLLWINRARGVARPWRHWAGRVVLVGLLMNTLTYAAVFWGMQFVPGGLSAVLNLAMIPLGLFAVGVVAREEKFSRRKLAGILLGVLGLGLLFAPRLLAEGAPSELVGMVAIVGGTLGYCTGSILGRPLLRQLHPLHVAGLACSAGGLGLLALTLACEPVTLASLRAWLSPAVLASWAYLVLGGTVAAYSIYLLLLRDWGPARAGLYAFVSPIVALVLDAVLVGERITALEAAGCAIMLGAAAFVIAPPAARG